MSPKQKQGEKWLPPGVDIEDARDVLRNPGHLDFYRVLAKLLDHTTSVEDVRKYVDLDVLLREFSHVKHHMRHDRLDESNRDYWEERITELVKGQEREQLERTSERERSTKSATTSGETGDGHNGKDSGQDGAGGSVEDTPARAVSTEQTETTQKARGTVEPGREMMGSVEESAGFENQVSDASVELSEELRKLRKKRDVTRNELAEASGISLQRLSEIERGREELTYDLMKRYVDGLGMDLDLDFTERDESSGELLEKVKKHIDGTIEAMDLPEELARHSRIVLHQIAEDGLHRERLPTLQDALNYIESAVKQFSIRDNAPDTSIFSNESLYKYLKAHLKNLDYSDLAYEENIKIVGQKMLERFHN